MTGRTHIKARGYQTVRGWHGARTCRVRGKRSQITQVYGVDISDNIEQATLIDFLSVIPDPRINRQKKYPLIEIFVEAIVAVMCGAETWNEIEEDAEDFEPWIRENLHLELKNGTPSHDTFRRVFSIVDPKEFQKAFCGHLQSPLRWQHESDSRALKLEPLFSF